jgi:hypothetical protein
MSTPPFAVDVIIRVEYLSDRGKCKVGFGRTIAPSDCPIGTRTGCVPFVWLYTYGDLLDEDGGPDEEALAEVNFANGDLADSDRMDTATAEAVRAAHTYTMEDIKFAWDGEELTPSQYVRAAVEPHPPQENAPADAATSTAGAEQLHQLREFLLAEPGAQWRTRLGSDWHILLNSLKRLGRDVANQSANKRLENHFFDRDDGDVLPGKVRWDPLIGGGSKARCGACGCNRQVTHVWVQMGWQVGSDCKKRIEALRHACDVLFEMRSAAQSSKPYLPMHWVREKSKLLEAARGVVLDALSNEHRGRSTM